MAMTRFKIFTLAVLAAAIAPAVAGVKLFAPTAAAASVGCPSKSGRIVIAPAGQSNAANYVAETFGNRHPDKIFAVRGGRCVIAADPLPGADGSGGSVWLEVANQLIERGQVKSVVIAPFALGGSGIWRWRSGGDLNVMFGEHLQMLVKAKLTPNFIPWVHGEADRFSGPFAVTPRQYFDGLEDVATVALRVAKQTMHIALASRCFENEAAADNDLRSAQTAFVNYGYGNKGPDLDAIIGDANRAGCHLTKLGAKRFADEWTAILAPKQSLARR